jgi:hypothetical protein
MVLSGKGTTMLGKFNCDGGHSAAVKGGLIPIRSSNWGFEVKLSKGLLLGSAAALVSVGGARAADLPQNQSAPIEYVRICDAYGAGFFFIPGTDTCLKIGGLALTEIRSYDAGYSISGTSFSGTGTPTGFGGTTASTSAAFRAAGGGSSAGYVPTPSQYNNARSRDAYGWDSLGRVELDTRTSTPWGTLRSFIRVDSFVGSGTANTGGLGTSTGGSGLYNGTAGSNVTRETTIVNKAFIQFAGLTAGRAQSMFDFYANAYNFQKINGSAATTQLLAYTGTFGGGFSATISVEDQYARNAAIGSTVASTKYLAGVLQPISVGGIASTGFAGTPAGVRFPDIVANLRLDEPWGAAQLSAAGHQHRASLFTSGALGTPSAAAGTPTGGTYAFPAETTNGYGFAVQGGVQLNADYLSPGDKLWLQAAYEQGAISYVWGDNLASSYGAIDGNRYYGSGFTPQDTSQGWNPNIPSDCVFTGSGICEQQTGWDITGAYKHYWLPSLSSAVFGSYAQINYSGNALAGYGGAVGVSNLKLTRVGTNLIWTPIKGFDIGGEFLYVNTNETRPAGLASDTVLRAQGLPGFKGSNNEYEGRIRVQRAF